MNKLSILLLLTANTVNSRMVIGSSCPSVDSYALSTIDTSRLTGSWYEVEKDGMFPWTMTCSCTTQEFQLAPSGDLRYTFKCSSWMMMGLYGEAKGSMRNCANTDIEGTCESNMDVASESWGTRNYVAVEDDWMATYKCYDSDGMSKTDYLMINHRKPDPSKEELEAIHTQIKQKIPDYDFDAWTWTANTW